MWNLDQYKKNVAVITEEGNEIYYEQLSSFCKQLIKPISKRCLVFNLCSNSIGSIVGYVAFLNHDVVPLLLSSDLDDELLERYLGTYKPDYLYVPDQLIERFEKYKVIYSNVGYSLIKTDFEQEYELYSELALLLTTSGSTGSPKLVRQSYRNIEANTQSIVEYLNLDETERAIATLPMNYTYGLSILNTHLYAGASVVMTEKTLMQKEFWEQFKNHEVTSFGGVPYTYEMLERLRFFRMELPSLRYMTQAGGKLHPDLHKKFAQYAEEHNKAFVVMYGQTEATARMSYLPPKYSLKKCASMGIAIPGGKFSLIDTNNEDIEEANQVGELVYTGENVTLGYAESGSDLAKGDERNGMLVTGDMAKFDEDGYFYIVGRKTRFLKIFGNRVNLDETERLIKSHFTNLECACAGIDDHMTVYITDPSVKNEMLKFVSSKTGLNRLAFQVEIINEIPKNDVGKPIYSKLMKGKGSVE